DGTDVAGAGGTVVRDPSVDDPQLAPYLVRADEDPPLHVQHRAFAHTRHPSEALRRRAHLVGGLLLDVRHGGVEQAGEEVPGAFVPRAADDLPGGAVLDDHAAV